MKRLLDNLAIRKTSGIVFNQYHDHSILNNLSIYWDYLKQNNHDLLLVGEAPGYQGCRLTGIPFTSGYVIKRAKHKIFKIIGSGLKLHRIESEPTATILWEFLGEDKPVPILWNAFPFHPHNKNDCESNRKPNREEIEEGKEYLTLVCNLFKPKVVCSLGRVGMTYLKDLYPEDDVIYIRHPSFGGKREFNAGMDIIYNKSFSRE